MTSIPKIYINSAQRSPIERRHIIHNDMSWPPIARAIPTRSNHLTVILCVKVGHRDCPASVELEYFVCCIESSAADYIGDLGAERLFEGCGIFADVGPPDVFNCGRLGW